MRSGMSIGVFCILAVVTCSAARAGLPVGIAAPGFNEPICSSGGLTGEEFRYPRDASGKIMYLEFNNPKCYNCKSLVKRIQQEVYPRYAGNPDVVFVQVAYAYGGYTVADSIAMIQETGCTQKVLADAEGDSYSAYVITGIPYSFIVDREGCIRYSRGGAVIPTDEVIATIEQLLQGAPPLVQLFCNAASYKPGDPVSIRAVVCGVSRPFDAYALIRQPGGSYLSMTLAGGLAQGVQPLAANIPSHSGAASYTLLQAVVPPGTTPGTYEVIVGLADPGTLDAFCLRQVPETVE